MCGTKVNCVAEFILIKEIYDTKKKKFNLLFFVFQAMAQALTYGI